MSLTLMEQSAIQNEFPSWTYQAEMRIDLFQGISEVLETEVFARDNDKGIDLELANMTISFNDLGGNAFQFQSVLNSTKSIGTSEPIARIGISEEPNTTPKKWWTLQKGSIHAMRQIPVSSTHTFVTFYIEVSGLCLPYVHAASTVAHCSMGDVRFTELQHPEPRYIGDFEPLSDNKQFSSMDGACGAVIARVLPIPLKKVGLGCEVRYKHTLQGVLPTEVPVCFMPLAIVDDIEAYTAVLSTQLLNWLKEQGISLGDKQEFIFTLSIYSPDEDTKTPWLIIESVALPLSSVQIDS
ncbi:hypothetical protein [Roseivirga sp. E12]|uniref:hypothetical protein n=1 Tax=Roseivirga sp. E12 TaxID=2819237 RepID=UPI001ABC9C65|nr:hypothetical protein [Roseivirga sp. E12]MBO3697270.1 hypothetical protein [Roseivirga sp. E12]